jgi:dihydroneopterin aldolase / 2-amino-4-hydroxy-6-hydroxymethyldihydropteridine diphosphokinase / dihydropteroate synthase
MILSSDIGPPHEVTVRACKPEAMPLAKSSEIVVTRTLEDFKHHPDLQPHPIPKSMIAAPGVVHTAALAIGSNLGDRFHNIELALRLLEVPGEVLKSLNEMRLDIVDTSFMYKTAPMYVNDQPFFLNCACMVSAVLISAYNIF